VKYVLTNSTTILGSGDPFVLCIFVIRLLWTMRLLLKPGITTENRVAITTTVTVTVARLLLLLDYDMNLCLEYKLLLRILFDCHMI
jgi:hypothetical protein